MTVFSKFPKLAVPAATALLLVLLLLPLSAAANPRSATAAVPCVEDVSGTLTMGTCTGFVPVSTPIDTPTNTPAPTPAPSGWTTVLDDEFTAAGIPSHYGLYDGHYGSGPSNNCAAPSQDSAPGDGYLYLTMSYKTSGTCGAGWYEGGMMISEPYDYRNQAVTVRFRILPSANPSVVRSHHIIPMLYPNDDPVYSWYNAEDDMCESGQLASCDTYLHDGTASDTSPQVYHTYTVDLTQWHTWRFEQKDGTLRASLDNMTTPIWTMSQGTSVLPDALRRLVLQQECPASACPPATAPYTSMKEVIQIDWLTLQVPA